LYADWRTIGFEDGSRGLLEQRIGDHRKACAEYGVTPDLALYRAGHAQGMISFCSPRNGFRRGQNGASYNDNCPPELEEGFLDAFRAGREVHQAAKALSTLEHDIAAEKQRLEDLSTRIAKKEKALIQKGNTEESRKKIYNQIKKLENEFLEAKHDLEQLYANHYAAEDSLEFLKDQYSSYLD